MDGDLALNINPINFFQINLELHFIETEPFSSLGKRLYHEKYRLPDLSSLCGDHSFSEVYLGWSQEGIALHTLVHEQFRRCSYPEVSKGDSVEVFIDTRDIKTSGFNTRYCHHFFCLPEEVENHQAGELTHFRTEDSHDWCKNEDLLVKATLYDESYSVTLFIPAHCLVGYEPAHFDRIGFAYRINRFLGEPQHFCVSSHEFQVEQQPSLWGSMKLMS